MRKARNPTSRRRLLRDLVIWQNVTVVLVLLGFLWLLGSYFFQKMYDDMHIVKVSWNGDELRFRIGVDSLYVVTYLAYPTKDQGEAIAALPEPVVIIESGGGRLDAAALKRLVWKSERTGEQVSAPVSGSPIWALYYRPLWTPERQAHARAQQR